VEQERLLLEQLRYQLSIKSKLKKITQEGVPFTGDFREIFPEYYNKCFRPIKKKSNSDFVSFKYYTDDGKGDDEDSEDSETDEYYNDNDTTNLLLQEIKLMFENGCTYEEVEKQFRSFFTVNDEKINLLFQRVYAERLKKHPSLMIEKDTDIYKSRQNQIEIIEKRRTLKNLMKKSERNKEDDRWSTYDPNKLWEHGNEEDEDEDEDLHSCKQYKAKKDFESVLHNEVQKVIKRKSERDEPSEDSEKEDEDEDTEELLKEQEQNRPRRFIRNTDDDSETEESEPRVILIAPPSAAPTPPVNTIIIDLTATPKFKRRKIIHDDN
jgi:hypothetical protein